MRTLTLRALAVLMRLATSAVPLVPMNSAFTGFDVTAAGYPCSHAGYNR